jgi:FMN phosphatase YigB (HAD superfamily)
MTILNYFGLTEYFDEIFCQESMGEKNKVNKFQNAIEKLDITPNIVIAFENEESEVLLALKAGIEIINPKMDVSYEKFEIDGSRLVHSSWNGYKRLLSILTKKVIGYYHDDYHSANNEKRTTEGTVEFVITTKKSV